MPRHITEVLGFCSTDVMPRRLGPTKRGRTSKERMPQQRHFPAASCPACSEPYVYPAPPDPSGKELYLNWARLGTKVQPAVLAHLLARPHCQYLCIHGSIRAAVGDAAVHIWGSGSSFAHWSQQRGWELTWSKLRSGFHVK